jgi:hypothetical protein
MNQIQRVIFLSINCLFIAKYTTRLNLNPYVSVFIYCLIAISILLLIPNYANRIKEKNSKPLYFTFLILILLGILILNLTIDPQKIQVDRWSAIHNFLHNLFNGIYPYAARTHLGGYGSPFPVWQAFHIPFYLLGNVGLGMFFTILVLGIFLVWYCENFLQSLIYLILLTISPAFWYEVAVRSDLIYNCILSLIVIGFVYKRRYSIQNQSLGLGILCGLFLSTRLSVVIPFAIVLFPGFLTAQLKNQIIFFISSLAVFVLTFLPFVFWDYNSLLFFKYNPFILQTRQGSLFEVIVLLLMIYYFATNWKNNLNLCFSYVSIAIVVFVAVTFLHRMISDNFANSLFSSSYDITYFSMALPFVIYSLSTIHAKKKQLYA